MLIQNLIITNFASFAGLIFFMSEYYSEKRDNLFRKEKYKKMINLLQHTQYVSNNAFNRIQELEKEKLALIKRLLDTGVNPLEEKQRLRP